MKKGDKIGMFGVFAMAAIAAVIPVRTAVATEYDLTPPGQNSVSIIGDVGGTAIFEDYFEQPTGTGVFQPFLTLDGNGQTSTGTKNVEQAYNTDGFSNMYLDQLRPQWNNLLKVGDLASVTKNGINYFAFILDSNEPGNDNANNNKNLISVDNIRVYTSPTDSTASVGSDTTKLNSLGTLRWAMNDPFSSGGNPNIDGFNVDQWVKLDSTQENVDQGNDNSNGGSGKGDMVVYVPQSAFNGANPDDYVWFYNLNGVHYGIDNGIAAESGYEEWRAVVDTQSVPDDGGTLALLGSALVGLGFMARRMTVRKA